MGLFKNLLGKREVQKDSSGNKKVKTTSVTLGGRVKIKQKIKRASIGEGVGKAPQAAFTTVNVTKIDAVTGKTVKDKSVYKIKGGPKVKKVKRNIG